LRLDNTQKKTEQVHVEGLVEKILAAPNRPQSENC